MEVAVYKMTPDTTHEWANKGAQSSLSEANNKIQDLFLTLSLPNIKP